MAENMSAELHAEGVALVDDLAAQAITLRLLGGAGVFEHCPRALVDGPYRTLADLDAITTKAGAGRLARALQERGYVPEARFNAMHGDRRMIFTGPVGKLDVFVDTFEMCHRIELRDRVALDERTLTVSDLLLTKLQIVELNAKDAQDLRALLAEHELGEGDGDHIDVAYLSSLVAGDWGLWRTLTGTLQALGALHTDVATRAWRLADAFAEVPKSRAWRLRARVGERKRWYELPDEVG
jgi:hypothetical protein